MARPYALARVNLPRDEESALQPRDSQSRTRASRLEHTCASALRVPVCSVLLGLGSSELWLRCALALPALGLFVLGSHSVDSGKLMSFAKYFSSPVFMTLPLGSPVTQMFDLQV